MQSSGTSEKTCEESPSFGSLAVGDISALDWIDSTGGSDDDEEILHRATRPQSRNDHNIYEMRECGDGDSAEDICSSLDRIDELDEDETDQETYFKKNSTFTIENNNYCKTVISSNNKNCNSETYSRHDQQDEPIDDDTKTILSGMSSLELDMEEDTKDDIHNLLLKLTHRIENLNQVLTNIFAQENATENVQELINNLIAKIENINLVITDVYATQQSPQISTASTTVIETLIGLLNQLIQNHNCLKTKINVGPLLGLITKIAPDFVTSDSSSNETMNSKLAPIYVEESDSELNSLDNFMIIEAPIEFRKQSNEQLNLVPFEPIQHLEYVEHPTIEQSNLELFQLEDISKVECSRNECLEILHSNEKVETKDNTLCSNSPRNDEHNIEIVSNDNDLNFNDPSKVGNNEELPGDGENHEGEMGNDDEMLRQIMMEFTNLDGNELLSISKEKAIILKNIIEDLLLGSSSKEGDLTTSHRTMACTKAQPQCDTIISTKSGSPNLVNNNNCYGNDDGGSDKMIWGNILMHHEMNNGSQTEMGSNVSTISNTSATINDNQTENNNQNTGFLKKNEKDTSLLQTIQISAGVIQDDSAETIVGEIPVNSSSVEHVAVTTKNYVTSTKDNDQLRDNNQTLTTDQCCTQCPFNNNPTKLKFDKIKRIFTESNNNYTELRQTLEQLLKNMEIVPLQQNCNLSSVTEKQLSKCALDCFCDPTIFNSDNTVLLCRKDVTDSASENTVNDSLKGVKDKIVENNVGLCVLKDENAFGNLGNDVTEGSCVEIVGDLDKQVELINVKETTFDARHNQPCEHSILLPHTHHVTLAEPTQSKTSTNQNENLEVPSQVNSIDKAREISTISDCIASKSENTTLESIARKSTATNNNNITSSSSVWNKTPRSSSNARTVAVTPPSLTAAVQTSIANIPTSNNPPQSNTTAPTLLQPPTSQLAPDDVPTNNEPKYVWQFQNGRLVFKKLEEEEDSSTLFDAIEQYADRIENEIAKCQNETKRIETDQDLILSRNLNKKLEGKSRLKLLEQKLKQAAGIEEEDVKSGDCSVNVNNNCEFDVNKIGDFQSTDCFYSSDSDFYVVYDEFDDDEVEDGATHVDSSWDDFDQHQHYHVLSCGELTEKEATMRGDNTNTNNSIMMATAAMDISGDSHQLPQQTPLPPQVKRHNPDHDNLKSLLKKPSKSSHNKINDHKKNRVVFNEKRNEFFDADYIILIREDCCDYDDEDEDDDDDENCTACTCNQHEMIRLTCCEPNCNCNGYVDRPGGYEQTPPSPKYAPPIEFVDAVTLSPPDGYKDMDLGEQQILALQHLAMRQQQQQQVQQQQRIAAAAAAAAQHMQQHGGNNAVCKECSAAPQQHRTHNGSDDSDGAHSENEEEEVLNCNNDSSKTSETGEILKTDQSQQTTPTTPTTPDGLPSQQQRYILETITMTTVTEQQIMRDADGGQDENDEDDKAGNESSIMRQPIPIGGSPISGILKGGRLWNKLQQQSENGKVVSQMETARSQAAQIADAYANDSANSGDESTTYRRSVRFCDSDEEKRTSGDEEDGLQQQNNSNDSTDDIPNDNHQNEKDSCNNQLPSPDDTTEMLLTFKLGGNHLFISNNSLRPNSAVRQLFPCANPLIPNAKIDVDSGQQYLITSESLRAFEETKRTKLPEVLESSCDTDSTIRKTIERNTLRRSLIRYEPRSKKTPKTDNSLVERIKQLTCDVDDEVEKSCEEEMDDTVSDIVRTSPPGEESRKSPEQLMNKGFDKNSFSPSSSSSTASSNSSMSSTYKKLTDLFAKKQQDKPQAQETQTQETNRPNLTATGPPPDLGNGKIPEFIEPQCAVSKYNVTHEARKQFLSTLAPLTACVGGTSAHEEYYYQLSSAANAGGNNPNLGAPGERASVASTVGTEYSLEDIDAVLQTDNSEEMKRQVAPDVLVGTPSASESGDELAMFVQQDAGRIERIKKRYQPENTTNDEDDEHDDYGFNRRPSVRGIKPRFSSTNEILQQIQNQLQPPTSQSSQPQPPPRAAPPQWPYYPETNINNIDNKQVRPKKEGDYSTIEAKYAYAQHQTYHYTQGYRGPPPTTYRPDESMYQNCTNQRCTQQHHYATLNHHTAPIMRVGCSEIYQTLPTRRPSGRPESPPPMEVARNYHQTMVLIPYNHIEGYHPGVLSPVPPYGTESPPNYRVLPKAKPGPPPGQHIIRQSQDIHYQCNTSTIMKGQKQMIRVPYSSGQPLQVHLMASTGASTSSSSGRSESPQLSNQFARATQTGPPPNYYASTQNIRYRTNPWQNDPTYVTKGAIRHNSMYVTRPTDDSQMNGYRHTESLYSLPRDSAPTSPTKSKLMERGVPEGAASVSPQDSFQGSAVVSPTQQTQGTNTTASVKPMYYAMNV